MLHGIGTDIMKAGRLAEAALRPGDPFLEQVFSKREQEEACRRERPYDYYCTRFAGKEAVFKALGIGSDGISLREIEILTKDSGQPWVILSGQLQLKAESLQIGAIHISLSYDTDYYAAYAAAERK